MASRLYDFTINGELTLQKVNAKLLEIGRVVSQLAGATGGTTIPGDIAFTGSVAVSMPHITLHKSSAQSIPNATWTELLASTVDSSFQVALPSGSSWDRFIIQKTGLYLVFANVIFVANATGYRQLAIEKNNDGATPSTDTTLAQDERVADVGGTTIAHRLLASALVPLVEGDYVQAKVYQNSTGSLNTNPAGGQGQRFGCVKVSD